MTRRKRSAGIGLLLLAACASAARQATDAQDSPHLPPTPAPATAASADLPEYTRLITPFPVLDENGNAYEHPFIGGFDVPRPQFIDIDADGDLDLFVQERSNELMFFENIGSAAAPRFAWRTDRFEQLEIGEWNRFIDLDHDGDYDLLAEEPYSYIRFFRNEGNAQHARFALAADSLRDENGKPIFADRQNIPNLTDVDCDGLLDLFLGRVEGTITRYEEVRSTNGVPRFGFVTDRFEGIEIIAQLGVPSMRHGANTMYWSDVDHDGDVDLFWGDFFEPGVLLIRNVARSCQTPNLRVEPAPVIVDGVTLLTSGYNVPVLADIDADNDADMFVGVLGGAYNPSLTVSDNFYFMEQSADGHMRLRTTRFINGIDVGTESAPALGDLDGDGDLDLLIGNKLDPKKLNTGRLYLFSNAGTPDRPAFQLADTLDVATAFHQAPALGDIDGDGDLDLLLGTWNDGVLVFRNNGTRTTPHFVQDTAATIRFTRGSNYTPALADIDDDGDLDVLVGEASGEINLVRNTGTRTAPQFALESENYQAIDAGRRSAPTLADIDHDGDLDLLIGAEAAPALFYRNTGTKKVARFEKDATLRLDLHHNATPAFADINGDGEADLFSGSLSGGLSYRLAGRR